MQRDGNNSVLPARSVELLLPDFHQQGLLSVFALGPPGTLGTPQRQVPLNDCPETGGDEMAIVLL